MRKGRWCGAGRAAVDQACRGRSDAEHFPCKGYVTASGSAIRAGWGRGCRLQLAQQEGTGSRKAKPPRRPPAGAGVQLAPSSTQALQASLVVSLPL